MSLLSSSLFSFFGGVFGVFTFWDIKAYWAIKASLWMLSRFCLTVLLVCVLPCLKMGLLTVLGDSVLFMVSLGYRGEKGVLDPRALYTSYLV